MTEQTQDVPVTDTGEPKAPPTPTISTDSAQVSSTEAGFDAGAFEERFKKLEEQIGKLPDLVDSRFKSTTDKSFQDVRKVAQYLEKFGSPEAAAREMAIDEMIEQRGRVDPGRSDRPSAKAPSDFDKRTAEILEEAGIPPDDPEVMELAKVSVASEAEWYRKLTRLGVRRAKQGNITPAAVVGSSGTTVVSGNEQETLLAELNDYYSGKHGSLSLPHNSQRLREITTKLNEIDPPKPI